MKAVVQSVIIALSLLLSSCIMHKTTYNNFQPKEPNTLRVATYNLYWLNGTCALNHKNSSTRLLQRLDADILVLQETTHKLETCIKRYLHKDYPYMEFHKHHKEGGLAILSRYPFSKPILIKPQQGWFPAWLFTVHTKQGDVQVLNIHLTPSVDKNDNVGMFAQHLFTNTGIRKKEIRTLYQHLNKSQPTIIAGDFNESDYGGAVKFLRNQGYKDVIMLDKKRQETWVHHYGPITFAGRYDRIFVSHHFKPIRAQILHESSSDHYPMIADVVTQQDTP